MQAEILTQGSARISTGGRETRECPENKRDLKCSARTRSTLFIDGALGSFRGRLLFWRFMLQREEGVGFVVYLLCDLYLSHKTR